jgi:DNA-binding MarR family transcriptional regulator
VPSRNLDVKRFGIDNLDTKGPQETATSYESEKPAMEAEIPMQDEVDRLVAAWARERPDLDVRPLEVLSRVTRLSRHVDRARGAAFAAHDLDGWEFDVLAALRRAGRPYMLSPGALVAQTLVTSGTMTNRIDRLESRGLVTRAPDPNDRRGVRVRLTARGKDSVDSALADLLESEQELLAALSTRQQDQLSVLLRSLVVAFETDT